MKNEEIRIKLPRPTPVQQKILNKASRYNAVAMGEKAGKTTLGIEVILASPRGAIVGGPPVSWFAPTEDAYTSKKPYFEQLQLITSYDPKLLLEDQAYQALKLELGI